MPGPAEKQPARIEKPTHALPSDALTADELAGLDERDPVDPDAALAWLNGEGPDPWRVGESS